MFDRTTIENILGRPISIGNAYPKEIKSRLLALVEDGSSVHQASKTCDVEYTTAKAWVRRKREEVRP
jgi:molybdenum-dependent DNA-binding transcriptional regulator ModE